MLYRFVPLFLEVLAGLALAVLAILLWAHPVHAEKLQDRLQPNDATGPVPGVLRPSTPPPPPPPVRPRSVNLLPTGAPRGTPVSRNMVRSGDHWVILPYASPQDFDVNP